MKIYANIQLYKVTSNLIFWIKTNYTDMP